MSEPINEAVLSALCNKNHPSLLATVEPYWKTAREIQDCKTWAENLARDSVEVGEAEYGENYRRKK